MRWSWPNLLRMALSESQHVRRFCQTPFAALTQEALSSIRVAAVGLDQNGLLQLQNGGLDGMHKV